MTAPEIVGARSEPLPTRQSMTAPESVGARSEPLPALGPATVARAQGGPDEHRSAYRAAVRSSHWLIASSALTTLVGLAYWVVAARLYEPAVVGRNAALIAAIMLLAGVGQLNVMMILLRFTPTAGRHSTTLVVRGYVVAAVSTMALATVFVLGVGALSPEFAFLRADPWLAPWFAVSVTVWALFTIQDHVLLAVRQASTVTVENLAFSGLKLLAVIGFALAAPSVGILLSWTLSAALAVAGTTIYLFARAIPVHERREAASEPLDARSLRSFGAADYLGQILYLGLATALPLLVVHREGAEKSAGLLLAWAIIAALHAVPFALAQSAVAHSADPGADLDRDIAALARRVLIVVAAVSIPLSLFAPQVLAIFGAAYSGADTALRLLALSVLPHALIEMAVAAAQIRRRMRVVVGLRAAQSVSVAALVFILLPGSGITGFGVGWLIAESGVAAGALALGLVRLSRPLSPSSGSGIGGSHAATCAPERAGVRRPGAAGYRATEPLTTRITVSAVVCCYTEPRWPQTVAAVRSLLAQVPAPEEVLLVVDHSPALVALARAEFGLRQVRVIASSGEPGLAGARNTALRLARGDLIAFLDDDATAAPGWLAAHRAAYADPAVLVVGGAVEPVWEEDPPQWFPPEFGWVVGCSYLGQPTEPADVRNVFGGAMSFRRGPALDAGGFVESLGRGTGRLPLGCEETELCIRLRRKHPDGRVRYLPHALVRHHVPAARARFGYFARRCWAEGVSKSAVANLAGATAALATERDYVQRTLPQGMGRALRGRRPRQAAAILAGLTITVAAYLHAQLRRRRGVAVGAQVLAALAVLGLWGLGLSDGIAEPTGEAGLVGVLSVAWFAAFLLAVVLLGWQIHRAARDLVIGAHLFLVVVIVHATPALLYPTVRYAWSWKHIGLVDYITRNGGVDPGAAELTIYHSWPGFFSLGALLTQTTGVEAATYARWAPVFFQLLFLAAAFVAFRAVTSDRRRIWLGLAIFALGNWVGQDYFAPQAMTYFLYLALIAALLRFWPPSTPRTAVGRRARALIQGEPPLAARLGGRAQHLLAGALVLLMAALASAHQLTPLVAVAALAVLVLAGMVGAGWAPWTMAALTAGWVGFIALTHRSDRIGGYWWGAIDSIALPWENLQTGRGPAEDLSATRLLVMYSARAVALVILALLVISAFRTARASRPTAAWLLAAVPAITIALTAYGGEVVLRAYLFALPFAAVLAAGAIYPTLAAARARRGAMLPIGVCVALALPFLITVYGNEKGNYFTTDEVAAHQWLVDNAPQGSQWVGLVRDYPWQYSRYEDFDDLHLSDLSAPAREALDADPLPALRGNLDSDAAAFILLSRSQTAWLELHGRLPVDLADRLETQMRGTTDFTEVFRNRDAVIFRHDPAADPAPAADPPPAAATTSSPWTRGAWWR